MNYRRVDDHKELLTILNKEEKRHETPLLYYLPRIFSLSFYFNNWLLRSSFLNVKLN